jgi:aquaporin Z
MDLGKRCVAEFIGTFWLVFGGCGSAVLAAMVGQSLEGTIFNIGISLVGVSFAFGLTVLTMAYSIGHISGCHLNPAVSCGLTAAGRFKSSDLGPYIGAQVLGAVAGALLLYLVVSGRPGFTATGNFLAANGYELNSPGKFNLLSCLLTEVVLTFMFLLIIIGSTDRRAPAGLAPIAIGLGLTLIHLIGIPVTNLSVNPARSTGPALVIASKDTAFLMELWLFWVAPILGGVLAGLLYKNYFEESGSQAKA